MKKLRVLTTLIVLTILFPLEWRWIWHRGAGM